MPYYWGNAYNSYLSVVLEFEFDTQGVGISYDDINNFIKDIIDWMDLKYGENGDCEDLFNPKSRKSTYTIFPPKETDKTKIGIWLRNFIDIEDLDTSNFDKNYNIYDYIGDVNSLRTLEKLFHSLDIDDQIRFIENIPTLVQELDDYYDRIPQITTTSTIHYGEDDEESEEEEDDESEEEEDDESEEEDDMEDGTNILQEAVNCLKLYLGNDGFEMIISYCEYINVERYTTTNLFSYLTQEFGSDLETYWNDIIIVAQSDRFGKLYEGYVADLMDMDEAPEITMDRDANDIVSCDSESDDEDDMPELEDVGDLSDVDDLQDMDITPISIDNNCFTDNLDDIAIDLSQVFQNEPDFTHLENNNNITQRNRGRARRSIRV